MSLSEPAPRRPIHQRKIVCDCFLRDDGLWDIEARITDTKPFPRNDWRRGALPAGTPLHDMYIRLTLNDAMVVVDAEAKTMAAPYTPCFDVAPAFKNLIGEKIGPGWRDRVRRRIRRTEGCTHMVELLDPMASSAYQAMSGGKNPESNDWVKGHRASGEIPFFVNGCHAWRSDGPVLKEIFPEFAERLASKQT